VRPISVLSGASRRRKLLPAFWGGLARRPRGVTPGLRRPPRGLATGLLRPSALILSGLMRGVATLFSMSCSSAWQPGIWHSANCYSVLCDSARSWDTATAVAHRGTHLLTVIRVSAVPGGVLQQRLVLCIPQAGCQPARLLCHQRPLGRLDLGRLARRVRWSGHRGWLISRRILMGMLRVLRSRSSLVLRPLPVTAAAPSARLVWCQV
jgi:hypothetical protein